MKSTLPWERPLALGIVVAALLAGLDAPYYPRFDSGMYIMLGRSLSEGAGYVDAVHPDGPPFPWYPPLYAAMLAAAAKMGATSFTALKVPGLCCAILAIALARPPGVAGRFDRAAAILIAGFGALHAFALRVQSDAVSALAVVLAVSAADRWRREGWHADRWLCATTAAAACGVLLRTQAVVALPCLILFALVESGPARARALGGAGVVAAATGAVATAWFATFGLRTIFDPATSPLLRGNWSEWSQGAPQPSIWRRAFAGARETLTETLPGTFFSWDFGSETHTPAVLFAVVAGVVLVGFAACVRRERTMAEYLFLGTLVLLVAKPTREVRYLVGFAPLCTGWFLAGSRTIGEWAAGQWGRLRGVSVGLAVGLVAIQVGAVAFHGTASDTWRPDSLIGSAVRVVDAVVPEGHIVLTWDHYGVFAATGRQGFSYSAREQRALPGYGIHDYMASGRRIDAAVVPAGFPEHLDAVADLCRRYGYGLAPVGGDERWQVWRVAPPVR